MSGAEIWKSVVGYEGLYEVSDLGRVRSLDVRVLTKGGATRLRMGRLLKPIRHSFGYPVVNLSKDGHHSKRRVHVLVLAAFVGARPPGSVSCHNDGDQTNSSLANLRYDTQASNIEDMAKHGTQHRGEQIWQSKLTEQQIKEIRTARLSGDTIVNLGDRYGVHNTAISAICRGKTWKHVGEGL